MKYSPVNTFLEISLSENIPFKETSLYKNIPLQKHPLLFAYHTHEFCGKTGGAIDVGGGKHVHFLKDFTKEEDNHRHEFQAATLINSPIDFKCK